MVTPIHTITKERLCALSPAERYIAELAIKYGYWKLEPDEKADGDAKDE